MINGGALEVWRDSTAEKRVCACCMLGVQEAGPVVGLRVWRARVLEVSTGSMLLRMLILVLLLSLFLKSL